jgi:hypothetical protein
MKLGLNDPTLSIVSVPFAGQEPVPEVAARPLNAQALLEAALLGDEDGVDRVRMSDEEDMLTTDAEMDHITVLGELLEGRERIASMGDER